MGPHSGGMPTPGGLHGPSPTMQNEKLLPNAPSTRSLKARLPSTGSLTSECCIGHSGHDPSAHDVPSDVARPGCTARPIMRSSTAIVPGQHDQLTIVTFVPFHA